jgi:hypothetical protein
MTETKPARDMIRRCRALRDSGSVEAVLRGEFLSSLRSVFPDDDDKTWINHYVEGTEALTKVGSAARFIDNLVNSTTIEYESDLRISAKRNTGFKQVKEHAAGLIAAGTPVSRVRGILSDTVEWHAYDVKVAVGVDPKSCTPDDITLTQIDSLDIVGEEDHWALRLIQFVRKHLAREQSRPLRAEFLASDFGLESDAWYRSASPLENLIENGRTSDPSVKLATELWSQFVDYLEGTPGSFRTAAYVDEAYVGILARLISANVLEGNAISSDDAQLKEILDGSYFRAKYDLENIVEQDYFGWLVRPSYINALVVTARALQRDLYAYDFSHRDEADLFGRLMAQLARRSQRKLLGQEWTPEWLARLLVDSCLDRLPHGEAPRIIDMCCGSGSIIGEVLKAARARFKYADIGSLRDVVTGFDIDPLAVALAKTTWVVTLADEIKSAHGPIVVPIFHADSLFAVTPVSTTVPLLGEDKVINISLDGAKVALPHALVMPEYGELFDRIIDWAYDEALDAKAKGGAAHLTKEGASAFLKGAAAAAGVALPDELKANLDESVHALVQQMAGLAVANRNGIWAFILRNAYRPGLLSGQFNGLVSNPPWLAMSGLADNPYREVLTSRAKLYGIRPSGQSFLHLELGTMHLLHAIDRYLKTGASISCLVPGSILNGHHHEPLRQRGYLYSKRPVALEVEQVWQVAPGTFKYPGAAIIGHKRAAVADVKSNPIAGFVAANAGLEAVNFSARSIGESRSAWVLEKGGAPAAMSNDSAVPPQGADLMPRSAVCVEIEDNGGAEWKVDTPQAGSKWGFTVKAAKELKKERFRGRVAPSFIFALAQSENLLPFLLGKDRGPIAIPATRDTDGIWHIHDETAIRAMGHVQSARRFAQINASLKAIGKGKSLQERVDERKKLSRQVFGTDGFLVLSGAGGKYICAAAIPVAQAQGLAIDQTLYWQVFLDADEAFFRVGILNSHAMTEAVSPFNPKGDFGERHIHTLPYRLMPEFDAANEDHKRIAELARDVADAAATIVASDSYLADPSRALPARRRKMREYLLKNAAFTELEILCATALGTTAFGGDGAAENDASVT